jgi:hypothetical protein
VNRDLFARCGMAMTTCSNNTHCVPECRCVQMSVDRRTRIDGSRHAFFRYRDRLLSPGLIRYRPGSLPWRRFVAFLNVPLPNAFFLQQRPGARVQSHSVQVFAIIGGSKTQYRKRYCPFKGVEALRNSISEFEAGTLDNLEFSRTIAPGLPESHEINHRAHG